MNILDYAFVIGYLILGFCVLMLDNRLEKYARWIKKNMPLKRDRRGRWMRFE